MIYFTKETQEKLDKLFYYPYTFGKHLDKANRDLRTIEISIPHLPIRIGSHSVTIRGVGTITYLCDGVDILIQDISWSTILTNFYYRKSNFIVFTSSSNITSVHPALYSDRDESCFHCDNGFKVVSRYVTIRGKRTEVFNFKDLNGHIICDIDFTQVKPFDEYKDMTARGYTPNRRCYMVFEDGYKEEVDESRNIGIEKLINECVDRCFWKYLKENVIKRNINESRVSSNDKEQMLVDLYNYLAQEPTDDIYNIVNGRNVLNTNHKAYNYFEPKGIVHNAWAVHYTYLDSWENIKSRGFRFGVTSFDELAYSGNYHDWETIPKNGGWNFALPIDNEYLGGDCGYGDCGFIIKTDGVRAYHKGDHDDEIIFKGCMVKKKIPFVYEEDCHCWSIIGWGDNYHGGSLPNGAYYEDTLLNKVVFKDVESLIRFVTSK